MRVDVIVDVIYKDVSSKNRVGEPTTIATETRELSYEGAVTAFPVGEIVTLPTPQKSTWSSNASGVVLRTATPNMSTRWFLY